jgi:hypothetical protein
LFLTEDGIISSPVMSEEILDGWHGIPETDYHKITA